MASSNFKCSQQELYNVVDQGWASCEQQLNTFAAFKSKYTPQFIADRRAELQASMLLPEDQARGEQSETARILLTEKADTCLSLWRKFRFYMEDAYPANVQKPKLDAAGLPYYTKASQYHWDSLAGLLTAANNFITANLADLTANQNMPDSFAATFLAAKTAFEANRKEFIEGGRQASTKTGEKASANNNLYNTLMKMFFEGQELFRSNEMLRKQFVFDQVLSQVSGAKTAGIRGRVTSQPDGKPLANATVRLTGTTKIATSDTEGRYEFLQVSAGFYAITVEKEGFTPATIPNHEVKAGVTGKLDVALTAV